MSFVRNVNDNIEKNTLETLRKHIGKSKINHYSFYTREISPATLRLHAHGLLIFDEYEDYLAMGKWIDMHHLKMYVDKWQNVLDRNHAVRLALYMIKDLKPDSKLYVDFNQKAFKDEIESLHPKIYNLFNPPKPFTAKMAEDPFMDSEEEIINSQLNNKKRIEIKK